MITAHLNGQVGLASKLAPSSYVCWKLTGMHDFVFADVNCLVFLYIFVLSLYIINI